MFLVCSLSFGIPALAIALQYSQDKRDKKAGLTKK
jgi:hypothetical protein